MLAVRSAVQACSAFASISQQFLRQVSIYLQVVMWPSVCMSICLIRLAQVRLLSQSVSHLHPLNVLKVASSTHCAHISLPNSPSSIHLEASQGVYQLQQAGSSCQSQTLLQSVICLILLYTSQVQLLQLLRQRRKPSSLSSPLLWQQASLLPRVGDSCSLVKQCHRPALSGLPDLAIYFTGAAAAAAAAPAPAPHAFLAQQPTPTARGKSPAAASCKAILAFHLQWSTFNLTLAFCDSERIKVIFPKMHEVLKRSWRDRQRHIQCTECLLQGSKGLFLRLHRLEA